jgi:hypothetical protein
VRGQHRPAPATAGLGKYLAARQSEPRGSHPARRFFAGFLFV